MGRFDNWDVYEYFHNFGVIDYSRMINELHRITHLPKWICRMIYDAENKILMKAGIMH